MKKYLTIIIIGLSLFSFTSCSDSQRYQMGIIQPQENNLSVIVVLDTETGMVYTHMGMNWNPIDNEVTFKTIKEIK